MKLKFKFKFNTRSVFRYLYIALIVANIIGLYYLYSLNNKLVVKTIFTDEEFLTTQATRGTGDINVVKFNDVIDKIRSKARH